MNPAQRLIELGQSAWYDNISRDLITSGELKKLIDDFGVRGITSNPSIFDKAIKTGTAYDSQIAVLRKETSNSTEIFEALAIKDISDAADILLPVYEKSNGNDGFVSIEVSPLLARDAKATVIEAKRLAKKIDKKNVMIKVPGTPESIQAVFELIEAGIHVNVTLLFSVENYIEVAETYCRALSSRLKKGLAIDDIRSVASFFVSRVDTLFDEELNNFAKSNADKSEYVKSLLGQFGVANSKLAYQEFIRIFNGKEFEMLKAKGAQVQRPLWASTSTKNPNYRDVLYVEELIGVDTVNTLPHETLLAFADHGELRSAVTEDIESAQKLRNEIAALGIDMKKGFAFLQEDGVKKFVDSFIALNKTISEKI